jgi:adenylate kinase
VRLVLLGAPGSGKGTQGGALSERLGVPHIATGDLLRDVAGKDPDGEIAKCLERGELVPDDLLFEVLGDVLVSAAESGGYILDGFPRTRAQAERLEGISGPDAVVYLDLPDEVARQRMAQRAEEEDRADDADPDVIERRLQLFHEEAKPLLEFYRERGRLTSVDASPPPDDVSAAILDVLPSGQGQT